MEFIYNESLVGTVDGVNKTFTTLYNIERIEEVYLGGAPYRLVSFLGNVVTFTDAPPLGSGQPSIDYFKETIAGTTPIGDVTYLDIRNEVYDILGQDDTSESYPVNMVNRYINKGLIKVKNEKFFKEKVLSYSFNKIKDGTITNYSSIQIDIGTKDYVPASGISLVTNSTLVSYSTYAAGKLGATSGIVYSSGDKIILGYKIPTGVKRVAEVIVNGEVLVYVDNREFVISRRPVFTVVYTSNGDSYLFLPFTDSFIVDVKYIPDYTILSADTDLVDIEYEYTDVVALYSAYKLLLFREDDRWQAVKREFEEEKKRLKSYKAREVESINNSFNTFDILDI